MSRLNEQDLEILREYARKGNRELYWNYLAQSAAVLARQNGLERIDHVLLSIDSGRGVRAGEHLFVVQGRADDPAHLRAMMRTDDAIARAPEQNEALLAEARGQQAQRAALQQQEAAQVATRDTPARSAG